MAQLDDVANLPSYVRFEMTAFAKVSDRPVFLSYVYCVNQRDGKSFSVPLEIPVEQANSMTFYEGLEMLNRLITTAKSELAKKVIDHYAKETTNAKDRTIPELSRSELNR